MAEPGTLAVRDPTTIREGLLRFWRLALVARGVTDANVLPGSDLYIEAQGFANQLAIVEANALILADEAMPDTATDEKLARICAFFGLVKQGAAGSVGAVQISSSAATTIAAGDQLLDGAGLTYEVITGGVFAINDTVGIRAIATGKATNLEAGSILRWITAPPYTDEKVTVIGGGLVNGIDAEDDETLRGRLYALLQDPPTSGNALAIAADAEASSPSVMKAFVHPAMQGGATYHVVVVAAPTATNKSRDVALGTVNNVVAPYVAGRYPEHAEGTFTSVVNVDADVAFGLSLPEAATANPPGPGGGWLDGSPWPAPDASTTWRCTVTGVTSTTVITVDAATAPLVGAAHVAFLSPFDWKLYTALVVGVSGTSGAYTITLDRPFVGVAVGCYVWPECENAQAYVDLVLAAFALMGPGEKTNNVSALVRGYRRPRSSAGWPMTLGTHLTRALTDGQSEIESAQFFHRTDGTTTLTGSAGVVFPQLPPSLTDPPRIFRPRHLAFYRVP